MAATIEQSEQAIKDREVLQGVVSGYHVASLRDYPSGRTRIRLQGYSRDTLLDRSRAGDRAYARSDDGGWVRIN